MSNYSLVIDSTFQPFTYQELLAPVSRMSEYHEKLAQEYDTLSSQADVLEAMGKNDRDKESGAYGRYKAYSDSLRKEADDLYRYGLNYESRRRLSDMRRRYNTDIVPIQNAWNTRKEEAKVQQELEAKNPGIQFTRDASQTSLDYYIDNPMGGYRAINPDDIYKDMYTAAKELEGQIRGGHLEGIDPYTANYIKTYGLTPDLIAAWQADPESNKALTAMYNQVLTKHGVTADALKDSPNKDRIMYSASNAAQLGAWAAVGKDESQIMELFGPRQARREAGEINNYLKKKAIDASAAGSDMPMITSEGAGIETKDGYIPNAGDALSALHGSGRDNLNEKIFGKSSKMINPMAVYEDYEKAENNRRRTASTFVTSGAPATSYYYTKDPKEETLKKYADYGITDILTKDQYNILKALGYDSKTNFKDYSSLEQDFNKLAIQHNRYSTNMASYEWPDDQIRKSLLRADAEDRYGSVGVWDIGKDGKEGDTSSNIKDLNLYSSKNTKGNRVVDIQYDPRYTGGKIVVTLSDGNRKIMNANVIDEELAREIRTLENKRYNPQVITGRIVERLNDYNKTKSKTDKNGEG